MGKYLLDPKDPEAFTPEVMYKVVMNKINFDIPEYLWSAIDDAFGNYWNVEVGYGSNPDLYSAVESIYKFLVNKNIVLSKERIADIVDIMFDRIEQIPGALLDEDDVVIPCSYADIEKERLDMKRLENELKQNQPNTFSLPTPNFNDAWTDFVFISDKLKEFFPSTYYRLTKLFAEMEIEWAEVKGTKDIWIRDYMPIQISDDRYLVYNYDPDYLKKDGQEYLTDSQTIYKGVIHHYHHRNIKITLDGGNVVPCADHYILTDKVFIENGVPLYDSDFIRQLNDAFYSDVIILPWHCDDSQDPYADVYGHADGLVKWTGGNRILMSNHGDYYPEEAAEIRNRLEDAGFEVTEMKFDVLFPNKVFNWAYINYLQVGNKIIVPTFGIPEDKQAMKYIRDANPNCVIREFRMRDIARNGGALHCITWNIKKCINLK